MKELGFQDLLRNALSACVGIGAFLFMYPCGACLLGSMVGSGESAGRVTLILGSILTIGTLIYTIHRALAYPVVFRVIGLVAIKYRNHPWWIWWPFQPTAEELEVDRWRWQLGRDQIDRWDRWGAMTHFLYCAAWATLLARCVGRCFDLSPGRHAGGVFRTIFFATLVGALLNNYRLLFSISSEMSRPDPRYNSF
jgi:hypothetical protein